MSARTSLAVLPLLFLIVLPACRSGDEQPHSEEMRLGATGRPNIVLFLVDDMGWQDTSIPFHTAPTPLNARFRTPNMERLAARGVTFTQAYAHAICSPTRVAILTGATAARHRVTNWTLRQGRSTDRGHAKLELPAWNVNGLSPVPGIERTYHARPLPAYLRDQGYRTIHVGKAHFGAIDTPGSDPRKLGYDVNVAGHAAGAPASYYGEHHYSQAGRRDDPDAERVWDVPGLDAYHGTDTYLTEALATEAAAAVTAAVEDEKPFFLYFAPYAVHTPIMAHPRYTSNYEGTDRTEAAYASMVEVMDAALGTLLDTLEVLEVVNQTVVIFTSDNGGLSAVARGGRKHTHNAPLSSGKGSAHEGGIRVPMLVAWPGVTRPGTRCDTPVISEDHFATVLQIAGLDSSAAPDGKSYVAALRGETLPPRDLLWHQPNNWINARGPGLGPHSTLRSGDWKLIYYHEREPHECFELFELANDISETRNLAGHAENFQDMKGKLGRALRAIDAQMPVVKQTGEPIPWPDAL